jgi:glycine hydroxymethyltransferase
MLWVPLLPPVVLKNVLFICTGNVCRSPMAELLFRDMVKGREDYQVGSAGVGALPGQPASKHTADLLQKAGIDASGFRSRPLTREMMREATHVFAMSEQHLRVMDYDFPDLMDRAYLVTEFAADDEIRGENVVDPIGMGLRAYEETRDMLLSSLPSVLAYIEQTTQPKTNAEPDT